MVKDIFPYKPRLGQVNLVKNMVQTIDDRSILLVSAPTGIGKTICALTAAIHSKKKCIFVTPRQSQHKIVIDSMKDIGTGSVLSIIGKKDMCINNDVKNNENFYEACLNTKCQFRYETDTFTNDIMYTEDFILDCMKIGSCPYYTALKNAGNVDVIIANYRHVFDPNISRLFFDRAEIEKSDYVLIVDEAHNLPDVLRDIASTKITETTINRAISETRYINQPNDRDKTEELLGGNILFRIMDIIYKPREIIEKDRIRITRDDVNYLHSMGNEVIENKKKEGKIAPLSYIQHIANFFSVWVDEDEDTYVRILENYKHHWSMHIKCLEPQILSNTIFEFDSAILMSGTLEPIEYFKNVLGLKNANMKRYPSIFPPENKSVFILDDLTTAYKSRTDDTYKEYAEKIYKISDNSKGNVMTFFPSYKFLHKVNEYGLSDTKSVITESKETVSNIHSLLEPRDKLVLAVERGSLCEGIDYPNNLVQTIIICGLPYPVMSVEQKALTHYYDVMTGNGFVMASLYPTINVVLQTMGRGIRSETDKCTIYLLDKRFKQYGRYFK